jgi:phosphoribosylformylglycinamidine synthase subunit PurS
MYKATIAVTLRPSILDPQGKTVHHALGNLGHHSVHRVRMGKHAELWIDEDSEEAARRVAEEACDTLIANPVTENYAIELEAVAPEDVPADAA